MAVENATSSSCAGSWTSNAVAPATIEEIKLASYLIISVAFEDFIPEANTTVPRQLNHFLDEVKDAAVSDASLTSAKAWLDTSGKCAYYLNPVHAVLSSEQNLSLIIDDTYRWRTKLTAGARDRTRLCASYDGKNKTSRLKTMILCSRPLHPRTRTRQDARSARGSA